MKKVVKKSVLGLFLGVSTLFVVSSAVGAHVVVNPKEVNVAQFQTFTIGVPNEKENPTVGLRLVIPAGLNYVSPNVKPGWSIEIKKAGKSMKGSVLNTGEKAPDEDTVTEISWTGGSIPAGQRDDFVFSAQAPASAGEVIWRAYQTYANGTVVAWDQTPNDKDDEEVKPYSTTKVIDDLATSGKDAETNDDMVGPFKKANLPLGLSVFAVGLSLSSFYLQAQREKKK